MTLRARTAPLGVRTIQEALSSARSTFVTGAFATAAYPPLSAHAECTPSVSCAGFNVAASHPYADSHWIRVASTAAAPSSRSTAGDPPAERIPSSAAEKYASNSGERHTSYVLLRVHSHWMSCCLMKASVLDCQSEVLRREEGGGGWGEGMNVPLKSYSLTFANRPRLLRAMQLLEPREPPRGVGAAVTRVPA